MYIYVYDNTLNLCGVVDIFKSLVWTRKYFQAGEFSLVAPATENNLELLKKQRLIVKSDSVEVGYISGYSLTFQDNEEVISCTGFMLSGLLNRRIIDEGDDDFLSLIDINCASGCSDESRKFLGLKVNKSLSIDSLYTNNLRYQNLAEYAKAICYANNVGLVIQMLHNGTSCSLELAAYSGVDRSVTQHENPYVVFSQEYDNLCTAAYEYNESGAVNCVYGYCNPVESGVSGTLPTHTLNSNNTGYDRYESSAVVDAVLSSSEVEGVTKTRIDTAATLKALVQACNGQVIDVAENVQGEILTEKVGYKTLWDLGDIVTVHIKQWGIALNQRIYEVCESYEGGAMRIVPTFGTPKAQLLDLLKGR